MSDYKRRKLPSEKTIPEWDERYNCWSLRIYGNIVVHVNWDHCIPKGEESGYVISCCGRTIIKRISNLETAQRLGIQLARKILKEANEALDLMEEKNG